MTDAFDYLQNIVESTSHRFDADVTTARIGKLRAILAHVEAQAAEIERLRAALTLVMDHPEVRKYLGSRVSEVADAALKEQ